jgi:predicted nucleic acid-binding protein
MGNKREKREKMKLVDTNIFIDFFRGLEAASTFMKENIDTILFSAITEAELLSGKECNNNKDKQKILHFLSQFDKIPVDNPLVQTAGALRRNYDIALPDAIIAASAILFDIPLVTKNIKHFEKIKELKIKNPY